MKAYPSLKSLYRKETIYIPGSGATLNDMRYQE